MVDNVIQAEYRFRPLSWDRYNEPETNTWFSLSCLDDIKEEQILENKISEESHENNNQ